jgi:hypothetical protein
VGFQAKLRTRQEAWLQGFQRGFAECRGRKPPAVDALMAVVALQHDATIATWKQRDFRTLGVRWMDPRHAGAGALAGCQVGMFERSDLSSRL